MEVTVLCKGNQVLECIIDNQSGIGMTDSEFPVRYLILTQCVRNVDVRAVAELRE